jgi:hypothetical protein
MMTRQDRGACILAVLCGTVGIVMALIGPWYALLDGGSVIILSVISLRYIRWGSEWRNRYEIERNRLEVAARSLDVQLTGHRFDEPPEGWPTGGGQDD